jgi:GntR family transcriptional repressor for pyruvate dehydrogenase complex
MSGGPSGSAPLSEPPETIPSEVPPREPEPVLPSERHHASDQVFRELASAILNREVSPGSPLPPERELSDRFGVSRIVVREAIHRLKEYELVRVRQGSPTIVLDPDRATDIRLLGLETELVPPTPGGMAAFTERQMYSAASLLDLAEQRMTPEEVDALEKLITEFLALEDQEAESPRFEREYWTAIATGTKNRVYLRETIWYFNLLERDPRFLVTVTGDAHTRALVYQALLPAQQARTGSAAKYLKSLRFRPIPPA